MHKVLPRRTECPFLPKKLVNVSPFLSSHGKSFIGAINIFTSTSTYMQFFTPARCPAYILSSTYVLFFLYSISFFLLCLFTVFILPGQELKWARGWEKEIVWTYK